jgi:mono/diheme cytochrome c family protein
MRPLLVIVGLFLAACTPEPGSGFAVLPAGDAARGAVWYTQSVNGAPACSVCHSLDGSALSGPTLQGYGAVASSRVAGESAEEYTYLSIVRPAQYLVPGYSNAMYAGYGRQLDPQQTADLIAYLLSL